MKTATIIIAAILIFFTPVIAVVAYLTIKVTEMIFLSLIEIFEMAAKKATNIYKEENEEAGGAMPPRIKTVTLDDINDEKPEQENETE